MLRKTIILTGFAVMAAGCATISEESCIAGSWESLGYEDATTGESRNHFNKIAETCTKYGITANATEYRTGYDAGLRQYCSYDKGYQHGTSGNWRKTECGEINATPYLDGYNEGLPLYCSFDRGFDHGEAGDSAKAQCRKINSVAYLEGHDEGLVIYALKKEYQDLIEVYGDQRAELEDAAHRLSNFEMSDRDRRRLQEKKRRLERDLDETRIDIRAFERVHNWPKQPLYGPDYNKQY